jgi:VIT1/CCC1 family predicted Fe2+/Mn2+ transporter
MSESQNLEHSHAPDAIALRISGPTDKSYLKDAIYGAVDGAVTTFAVVSGVAGAGLPPSIIIILGLANLFADGFSMAAANFLGTRAEKQQLDQLRRIEQKHINECPDGEREEVRQILIQQGFDGRLLVDAVQQITSDERTWVDTMLQNEYGLSLDRPAALPAAVVTFFSFLVIGSLPLLPFIWTWANGDTRSPYLLSALMTGIAFFIVGAIKSRFVYQRWWWSGFETLAVGAMAAAIAFLCGYALAGIHDAM